MAVPPPAGDADTPGTPPLSTITMPPAEALVHMAAIVAAADEAIISLTPDGKVLYANAAAERLWKIPAAEALGRDAVAFLAPAYQADLAANLAIVAGGTPVQVELVYQRRNGSDIFVAVTLSPVTDATGRVTSIAAVIRDMTRQHVIEQELRRRAERERTILEEVSDGILLIDAAGVIREANRAIAGLVGWPPEDLAGRRIEAIIDPADQARQPVDMPGEQPGAGLSQVRWLCRRDGVRVPVEAQVHRMDGGDVLAIFWDQTERLRLEEEQGRRHEQELAAAAARTAEQLKTELINSVSHELRTPLGAIHGFATMLQQFDDKIEASERRDVLQEIVHGTERLTAIVNDLLAVGSLDERAADLARRPVALAPLLLEEIRRFAPDGCGAIALTIADDLPAVAGDARLLAQVVVNLLNNAVKYSPAGTAITLRAWKHGPTATPRVAFAVTDEGIGIPAAELSHVFERFYRGTRARAQQVSGSGLGLAICKQIVEAHGGAIAIASEPGCGTTVTVHLPALP